MKKLLKNGISFLIIATVLCGSVNPEAYADELVDGEIEEKAVPEEVIPDEDCSEEIVIEETESVSEEIVFNDGASGKTEGIDSGEGYKFLYDDKEVILTEYIGSSDVVNIYGSVKDASWTYPRMVTGIEPGLFKDDQNIRAVSIHPEIVEIPDECFRGALSLETVIFVDNPPNNASCLKKIGNYAFEGCEKLTDIQYMPGDIAFGNGVFKNCTALSTVNIPNISSVGYDMFAGCTNLRTVLLADDAGLLGQSMFKGCTALESVSSLGSTSLPDSIKAIPDEAFRDCTSLKLFYVPQFCRSIGDRAFYGCRLLQGVDITDATNEIGLDAFEECPFLIIHGGTSEESYSKKYADKNRIQWTYVRIRIEDVDLITGEENGFTYIAQNGFTPYGRRAVITGYTGSDGECESFGTTIDHETIDNADGSLSIKSDIAEVVFDRGAVLVISEKHGGQKVEFCYNIIDKTDGADDAVGPALEAALASGGRIMDFSLVDAGGNVIPFSSSQGNGSVTVTVPFETDVSADRVKVYYVAIDGTKTDMNGTYDPSAKTVTFTTTHFSYYTIELTEENGGTTGGGDPGTGGNDPGTPGTGGGTTADPDDPVLAISPSSIKMKVGTKATLEVSANKDGVIQEYRWSSSDSSVATVNRTTGEVTAIGEGSATITVKATGFENSVATCLVTVTDGAVYIFDHEMTIAVGETQSVEYTTGNGNDKVAWTSSAPGIASVFGDGNVTGIREGEAVIRAALVADPTIYDECLVVVRGTVDTKPTITIIPTTVTIEKSSGKQLVASVSPAGSVGTLVWSSSDSTVASVGSNGYVTAVSKGTAYITARMLNDSSVYGSCTVTVTEGGTGGSNPGGENPGGETPGGENPGGNNPGGENPGGSNPGGNINPDDPYGDIIAIDRPATVAEIPAGLWISSASTGLYIYTGKAMKPEPRVYYGNSLLVNGRDYSLSYKNNVNAIWPTGSVVPTVIAKGKSGFSGTTTASFPIYQKNISDSDIDITFIDAYMSGSSKNPTLKFTAKSPTRTLKLGTDYTLTVKNTAGADIYRWTNTGTYILEARGIKNYTGVRQFPFYVGPFTPASKLTISGIKNQKYIGGAITQPITVKYKKEVLDEGVDYYVTYLNNTAVGTATVLVTGRGSYIGTVKKTFKITGTSMSSVKATDIKNPVEYSGTDILQPQAVLTYRGAVLTEGVDYTVSYKNNVNKGTASVIYTGLKGFTGTLTKKYKIKALSLSGNTGKMRVSVVYPAVTQAGNQIPAAEKPKVYDTIGGAKVLLREGRDYTLSQNRKTNSFVIKGRGNYSGTIK